MKSLKQPYRNALVAEIVLFVFVLICLAAEGGPGEVSEVIFTRLGVVAFTTALAVIGGALYLGSRQSK